VVSADAGGRDTVESDDRPRPKEATMAAGSEIPHQAPRERGAQLVDRIEDAAFLFTLFAGVSLVVATLLLFVVL
jgi:hypothetical protein